MVWFFFFFRGSKGGSLLRVKGEENKKWFGLSPLLSRFRGRESDSRWEPRVSVSAFGC